MEWQRLFSNFTLVSCIHLLWSENTWGAYILRLPQKKSHRQRAEWDLVSHQSHKSIGADGNKESQNFPVPPVHSTSTSSLLRSVSRNIRRVWDPSMLGSVLAELNREVRLFAQDHNSPSRRREEPQCSCFLLLWTHLHVMCSSGFCRGAVQRGSSSSRPSGEAKSQTVTGNRHECDSMQFLILSNRTHTCVFYSRVNALPLLADLLSQLRSLSELRFQASRWLKELREQ